MKKLIAIRRELAKEKLAEGEALTITLRALVGRPPRVVVIDSSSPAGSIVPDIIAQLSQPDDRFSGVGPTIELKTPTAPDDADALLETVRRLDPLIANGPTLIVVGNPDIIARAAAWYANAAGIIREMVPERPGTDPVAGLVVHAEMKFVETLNAQ